MQPITRCCHAKPMPLREYIYYPQPGKWVPPGHGKSWNLGRPFSRPGKSWKIAEVMESHGK